MSEVVFQMSQEVETHSRSTSAVKRKRSSRKRKVVDDRLNSSIILPVPTDSQALVVSSEQQPESSSCDSSFFALNWRNGHSGLSSISSTAPSSVDCSLQGNCNALSASAAAVDNIAIAESCNQETEDTEWSTFPSSLPHDSVPTAVSGETKNFLEQCCNLSSVCEFVKATCRRSFPAATVWGSNYNQSAFMGLVDCFVRLGRHETLSMRQLVHPFRLHEIPWILSNRLTTSTAAIIAQPSIAVDKKGRKRTIYFTESSQISRKSANVAIRSSSSAACQASTQEEQLSRICLQYFLHWIFADFIIPLLRSCFYVTEGQGTGLQTLYYRRPTWRTLMQIGRQQMQRNFVEVTHNGNGSGCRNTLLVKSDSRTIHTSGKTTGHNVTSSSVMLPGVRFLPKKTSVRAITNFKGQVADFNAAFNTNSSTRDGAEIVSNAPLYNCLHVLRSIALRGQALTHYGTSGIGDKKPLNSFGFGVLGIDDAYQVLRSYRTLLQRQPSGHGGSGPSLPKLYCATLDLEKCFDNIDTKLLYDIVAGVLATRGGLEQYADEENQFLLHKYFVTRSINSIERTVTRTVRHVSHPDDMIRFQGSPFSCLSELLCLSVNDVVI
jgi:hypothetical protein